MTGYFDRLLRQVGARGARGRRSSAAGRAGARAPAEARDFDVTERRVVPPEPSGGDGSADAPKGGPSSPGGRPDASPPGPPPVRSYESGGEASARPGEPGRGSRQKAMDSRARGDHPQSDAAGDRRRGSVDRAPLDAGAVGPRSAVDGAEGVGDATVPADAGRAPGRTSSTAEPGRRGRRRPSTRRSRGDAGDSPSAAMPPEVPEGRRPTDSPASAERSDPVDPRRPGPDALAGRGPERVPRSADDGVAPRGERDRESPERPRAASLSRDDPYRLLAEVREWVAATPAPGEAGGASVEASAPSARAPERGPDRAPDDGERDTGRAGRSRAADPLEAATHDVRLSIGRIDLTVEGADRPAPATRRRESRRAADDAGRARSRLRRHFVRLP